jgi:hypothetical protein
VRVPEPVGSRGVPFGDKPSRSAFPFHPCASLSWLNRGHELPQGSTRILVTTAPKRPVPKPNSRTDAERLADMLALIRRKCHELNDSDIALLTRVAARGQASRRRRAVPP